jgi:hypothetical protein
VSAIWISLLAVAIAVFSVLLSRAKAKPQPAATGKDGDVPVQPDMIDDSSGDCSADAGCDGGSGRD